MTPLYGHDDAVAAFRAALDAGRLHHAWLIAGAEGIGKALFADKAALRVLAQGAGPLHGTGLDVPDDHPAARLAAAGSHPDLMRLERLTKDGGTELARSISVDQVRGLQRLFATTSSLSPWRVVVIDSIDDLERNAANALLKNLEEPPPSTVFLLVSHAPERLLPTIRSRCRVLRLAPLGHDVMASALRAALPDADEAEIAGLVAVGEGAPGRAIAYRGLDIDSLDRAMRALVEEGDPTNAKRAALASALSGKAAQPRYEAFLARTPSLIAAMAKQRRGPALAEALALWERASGLAGSARRLSLDVQSTVFELGGMLAALAHEGERRAA
ncbi:DNA polymerase III subunit delta' [Sphingosinicella terrae]|uniref:DNA polymerase III subunit delta' n=1 Tax=Sphingosinicella terrae TaxID=2172047 RepID=UPI000E0D1526|nr:DNA polymerase III subunit delta' [Sphingosinicella terrae]